MLLLSVFPLSYVCRVSSACMVLYHTVAALRVVSKTAQTGQLESCCFRVWFLTTLPLPSAGQSSGRTGVALSTCLHLLFAFRGFARFLVSSRSFLPRAVLNPSKKGGFCCGPDATGLLFKLLFTLGPATCGSTLAEAGVPGVPLRPDERKPAKLAISEGREYGKCALWSGSRPLRGRRPTGLQRAPEEIAICYQTAGQRSAYAHADQERTNLGQQPSPQTRNLAVG